MTERRTYTYNCLSNYSVLYGVFKGGIVERLLVYLQQHVHVSLSLDRVILYNRVRKKKD